MIGSASEVVRAKTGNEKTAMKMAVRQYRSATPLLSPRANRRAAAGMYNRVKLV